MGPPHAQNDERQQADRADEHQAEDGRRGVMKPAEDRRQGGFRQDRDQRQADDGGDCRQRGTDDCGACAAAGGDGAVTWFEQHIGDHHPRKDDVPADVEPCRRLRAGAEQPGRSEYPGEGQRVRHRHQAAEQITAGQHQQCPRTQDAELSEQQDRGDQVIDQERRFIGRHKGRHHRQLDLGERCDRDEDDKRQQRDCSRQPPIAPRRRHRRQEDSAIANCLGVADGAGYFRRRDPAPGRWQRG